MNRWDEIQAVARDVADWVDLNPDQRDCMADDLIKLIGLMIQATGKSVALAGESAMNGLDSDDESGYEGFIRYQTGQDIQLGARTAVEGSAGVDLERYERDGLTPAWVSRRDQPREGESAMPVVEGASRPQKPPEGCDAVEAADLDAVDAHDLDWWRT